MFVPFITGSTRRTKRTLFRRKGGGGGGKGGGGGSSSGKSSGGSGSSGSSSGGVGAPKSVPLSGSTPSGKSSATAYGAGGGKTSTIPAGQPFSGRSEGGGTRNQVFGTQTYGSGYPGISNGRGVGGLGFPFFFWPVVWAGAAGAGSAAYLHTTEYGAPDNSSRPGGAMTQAIFVSNTTNTTFHVLSDNSTVASLIQSIDGNCSSNIGSVSGPQPLNGSAPGSPQPEQAIQYYRSSSVVLTLDGYNNTAALSNDTNAPPAPLPSGIDTTLLDCVNQTIGLSVPLIGSAGVQWSSPSAGIVGLVWLAWHLLSQVL